MAERLDGPEVAYWSQRVASVLAKNEPTIPWDEAVAGLANDDSAQ